MKIYSKNIKKCLRNNKISMVIWGITVVFIVLIYYFTLKSDTVLRHYDVQAYNTGFDVWLNDTCYEKNATLPMRLNKSIKGPVYLTKTLQLISNDSLLVRTSHQFLRIYIGNKLIYDFGIEQMIFGKTPGSAWHFIALKESYIGKKLTLVFYSPHKQFANVVNEISIGDNLSLVLHILKENKTVIIWSCIIFILGALLLLSALIIRCLGTKYDMITYLGSFTFFFGIWLIFQGNVIQLFIGDSIFILNMEMLSLYIVPIFMLLFIDTYNPSYRRYIRKNIDAFIFFIVVTTSLQILKIKDYFECLPVFHAMLSISILTTTFILYKTTKQAKLKYVREAYTSLLRGFFAFGVGVILNVISFIRDSTKGISYFSQIGFAVLLLYVLRSIVFICRDFNKKKKQADVLRDLAYTDELTGVRNRNALNKTIQDLKGGEDAFIAVAIIDLNEFKKINDTFGHSAGDEILRQSAILIQESFEDIGKVYRIGGDEFAILAKVMTKVYMQEKFKDLLKSIENYNEKAQVPVSMSWGMAFKKNVKSKKDVAELFEKADENMYKFKKKIKKEQKSKNEQEYQI